MDGAMMHNVATMASLSLILAGVTRNVTPVGRWRGPIRNKRKRREKRGLQRK